MVRPAQGYVRTAVFIAVLFLPAIQVRAQTPPTPYYEESVSASNPGRTEQAKELDAYIVRTQKDASRLDKVFKPDYTSPRAYEKSAADLRKTFFDSIGYPPPGRPDSEPPQITKAGEDSIGTYYRARISVLPGVHAIGLYIVPKGLRARAPLVISMHGGGGSPEVALFHGGANYHDMVRGAVKRGYVVWAPQHLFNAQGYPADIRNQIDKRARMVGTTITAIEIAKITRSLDVLLKRPEVDPKRVGMVGLSYGGFYTLVTMAADTRIKAGVSSCYFGCQDWRFERDELGVPSDFQFNNAFTLIQDPEIVALICPRPLEIQAGKKDDEAHRDGGIKLAPKAAQYYEKLGKGPNFRFHLFDGGHEFNDKSAWEWISRHL